MMEFIYIYIYISMSSRRRPVETKGKEREVKGRGYILYNIVGSHLSNTGLLCDVDY